MKKKFVIHNTAAGSCCSGCGKGFFTWTGPDEPPCTHELEEFSKKSLREYLKRIPENKEVRNYLNGKSLPVNSVMDNKSIENMLKDILKEVDHDLYKNVFVSPEDPEIAEELKESLIQIVQSYVD